MNAGLGLQVINRDRGRGRSPTGRQRRTVSRRPLGWVADAFPAPALAPAARGRSVEGDSSRNEVPFNLGALGELLTCHWHPLILKRKKLREPRDP